MTHEEKQKEADRLLKNLPKRMSEFGNDPTDENLKKLIDAADDLKKAREKGLFPGPKIEPIPDEVK